MAQVTKDMLIGQLLQLDPNMAAMVHGIDADVLIQQLNDYLAGR